MFAFAAVVASVIAVNAQDASSSSSSSATSTPSSAAVSTDQQGDKAKIKADELPDAVKKSLEAQEYKGWLINTAYEDKKAGTYEVELKNGAETKTIKFDKEGKKIG